MIKKTVIQLCYERQLNFYLTETELNIDEEITPLIYATALGRVEIVKYLLSIPFIDVDQSTPLIGHTALTIACITGNYEIIVLLVEANAEVNKPTKFNQTPFVCCFQRLEEQQNIFENRKICLKMAEKLLQSGADIDWIVDKKKGHTILMQLCDLNDQLSPHLTEICIEIVRFLVENGANRSLQDCEGKICEQLIEKHKYRAEIGQLLSEAKQLYFYKQDKKQILNEIETNRQKMQQLKGQEI